MAMKILSVNITKLVCSLDTVDTYANNILQTVATLDSKESNELINSSKNWYRDANKLCRQIGAELNLSAEIVAGVVAVLSPNQNWLIQERHTKKFISDILNGVDYKSTGYGYYANREKASKIILNKKVFPYLSGQKVTAFYSNIVGKYSNVTIDIWAVRIALNDYSLNRKQCGLYMRDYYKRDEIVRSYHVAANRLKLPVAVLQSLSWVIGRNIISKKLEKTVTI